MSSAVAPAAIAPVLGSANRASRASVWRLVPVVALQADHAGALGWLGPLSAVGVSIVTAALVVHPVRSGDPAAGIAAGVAGYLVVGSYVLPWYFGWALPVIALAWSSQVAVVVVAQS